ncbi:MAG: protein kinase [Polyangiaceae bacterium]|nr:protein kinase [Polyangiaceae bacterium]
MRPGDVIAGRYEIVALAGMGGMGAVYRARDRGTGDTIALKVVRGPGWRGQAGGLDATRFAREAEVLATLTHPGIVRYVAHGRAEDGDLYLAMEWLEGEDLAARLRRAPMTIDEAVLAARGAAAALAAAHARGVVHRDVKPSNLFLVDGRLDRVKILDFGVARGAGGESLTREGSAIGTPGYMSPEQARGDFDLDARADVFALGCVLFECLTGRPAFVGEHALALLAKILLEDAPRVREIAPEVPSSLQALVERMMAKDRAERPADAAAVALALDALAAAGPSRGDAHAAAERAGGAAPPSSLTRGEQRMLCVVMARAGDGGERDTAPAASAPTLVQDDALTRFEEISAAVAQHGGRMERLVDGSVAVMLSGLKGAMDQAAQAARCALSLRAVLPGAPMALATGRALVGRRWPVGEAIDRASRLLLAGERAAACGGPGERPIRIDEVTAGLVGARFEVKSDAAGLTLGPERDEGDRERRLLGQVTPCVGRDRELSALLGLFDEVAGEGVARAALLTGPPGVGKSRLCAELCARIRERGEPVEIWIGRGDPISAGSPFGLLAAALRRAAGIVEGEPLPLRRQKLRARAGRHAAREDQDRIAAFLGELVGAPAAEGDGIELRAARRDPVLLGDQMRRAWEDFLAAECAAQPVLLVLEDLHWGDLPSISFIDSALRNVGDAPWMVLGLARPEYEGAFPRIWSERNLQEIHLAGIGKKASERLARHVLGAASAEVIARIVDQAGGNAFYLEELVRAVAEGKGDRLPETVLAVVEARLDALKEEERRVLRAASVFGRVFWERGVARLLGVEGAAVRAALVALADRELVAQSGTSRFPTESELSFRHALVREAAYRTLTDADRALGHRLAGAWLEGAGEVDALALAEHFERGQEPGRAAAFYRRAAEQALGGDDFAAVLARADRGVASGASGEALGALRLLQAEAHTWRGEHALAALRGLEAMAVLPEGSAAWCEAAGEVVIAGGRLGDHDALVRIAGRLAALPVAGGGSHLVAMARASMQLYVSGHYDLAARLVERLEAIDPTWITDDPVALGRIAQARAFHAHFAGDAGAYLARLKDAAASFDRAGDRRNACVQRGNVGHAHLTLGAYAEAERALADAHREAERMGLRHIATVAKHNLGLALARLGRIEEARAAEREARDAFAAQGDVRLDAAARTYLALIELAAGDPPAAEREARAAAELATANPPLRAFALGTLARALLESDRAAEALPEARAAMAILDDLGGIDEGEAIVRLSHADALRATGDADGARAAILEAAARIEARAAKIQDAAHCEGFLARVPENAAIRVRAAAWGPRR